MEKLNFPFLKINILAVGGGGISILEGVAKRVEKVNFFALDTDYKVLKRISPQIKKILLGEKITHGLGTGMNVNLAKEIAVKEKEKFEDVFKGDLLVLISSLGGGVGSGISQVIASLISSLKVSSLGFFTLPFKFEGIEKTNIAKKALGEISQSLNATFYISNQNIFRLSKDDLKMTEALEKINEIIGQNLNELIKIISRPTIINLDFADLRSVLSEKGKIGFLNTVQSEKAEEVVQNLFYHPLLDFSLQPEKVFFNVSSGRGIKLKEVKKIGEAIYSLNKKAQIIFGISKEKDLGRKLKAVILAIGEKKESERKRKKVKRKIKRKKRERKVVKKIKRKNALQLEKEKEMKKEKKFGQIKEFEIPPLLRRKGAG